MTQIFAETPGEIRSFLFECALETLEKNNNSTESNTKVHFFTCSDKFNFTQNPPKLSLQQLTKNKNSTLNFNLSLIKVVYLKSLDILLQKFLEIKEEGQILILIDGICFFLDQNPESIRKTYSILNFHTNVLNTSKSFCKLILGDLIISNIASFNNYRNLFINEFLFAETEKNRNYNPDEELIVSNYRVIKKKKKKLLMKNHNFIKNSEIQFNTSNVYKESGKLIRDNMFEFFNSIENFTIEESHFTITWNN
ncbi:hypothetical protein HK099_007140 [Clydaea vesicula]|uniref:Uncharacterized protein n=1 Tax=Clydaea vesicula TaxID=447962 RepID=A0AAD5U5P4_9FUNG|nr:hypothetical protein HK099_007140 [Clydaea vesicula]